jgi:N-glycosidase YbiA
LIIYFYQVDAPYGCFSNFSPHAIVLPQQSGCANECGDKLWPTVEHYYQAHKFQDTKFEYLMAQVHAAPTPKLAAQIGRDASYQPHPDWNLRKYAIMYRAVWQKFRTHLDIQQILLDTGDAEIVEDSAVDYFWGCGLDRTGENQLGRILMRVRAELGGFTPHSEDGQTVLNTAPPQIPDLDR